MSPWHLLWAVPLGAAAFAVVAVLCYCAAAWFFLLRDWPNH